MEALLSDASDLEIEITRFRTLGLVPRRILDMDFQAMRSLPAIEAAMDAEVQTLNIYKYPEGPFLTVEMQMVLFRRYLLLGEGSAKECVRSVGFVDIGKMRYPKVDEFRLCELCGHDPRFKVNWHAVEHFQQDVSEYEFQYMCKRYYEVWGEPRPKLIARQQRDQRAKKRRLGCD